MILPKKDWTMYCTRCDKDLFRFKRDITGTDTPNEETLEPIGEQKIPEYGAIISCSHCGHHIQLNDYREGKQT